MRSEEDRQKAKALVARLDEVVAIAPVARSVHAECAAIRDFLYRFIDDQPLETETPGASTPPPGKTPPPPA